MIRLILTMAVMPISFAARSQEIILDGKTRWNDDPRQLAFFPVEALAHYFDDDFLSKRINPKGNVALWRTALTKPGYRDSISWENHGDPVPISLTNRNAHFFVAYLRNAPIILSAEEVKTISQGKLEADDSVEAILSANCGTLQQRGKGDAFAEEPFRRGEGLELVPVINVFNKPLSLARHYKFQLLFNGQPLKNATVKYWTNTHGKLWCKEEQTDDQGMTEFALNATYYATTAMLLEQTSEKPILHMAGLTYTYHYSDQRY